MGYAISSIKFVEKGVVCAAGLKNKLDLTETVKLFYIVIIY